jgi:hypothetical protein
VIKYLHHQLCPANRLGQVPGTSLTVSISYPERSAHDVEMNRIEK